MFAYRGWGYVVLSCIVTLWVSQEVHSESDVSPAARRRANTDQQAAESQSQASPSPTMSSQAVVAPMVVSRNSAQKDPLLLLAERAIDKTSLRYLDADQHTPWQIMHGVVALRQDFVLKRGDGTVRCIDFLSDAPTFRGEPWWQVTRYGGRAHPFSVPYAFEGHANQFLALLSMSNLPLTHEFRINDQQTVTMADMVENAKMTVNTREEITWTLWFLTHYLDIDTEWINALGEPWSLEELVRVQTKAPVVGTPCGGCHGLFAIAYARNAYLKKHGRLHGIYYQAEQKLEQHIELARSMQNYDGSFSSEFFKGTGHSRDFNERLKASGHMLEWLMMALPQSRLREAWVRKGVASIATDLIHNASQPAECGPLYHALNSLIMYRDRVRTQPTPAVEAPSELAQSPEPQLIRPFSKTPKPVSQIDEGPESQPVDRSLPTEPLVDANRSATGGRLPVADPFQGQPLPTIDSAEQPVKSAEQPGEQLAKRAGERLATIVRRHSAMEAEEGTEPPRLLLPVEPPSRLATEPTERTIR